MFGTRWDIECQHLDAAKNGFDMCKQLRPGYRLLNPDGGWAEVVSVEERAEPLDAWNLTVKHAHSYFVAGRARAEMMVQTFDAVGVGQWFRYVTGVIEVGSAILLWVPGLAAYAAGLSAMGLGAAVPAVVLGVLAAMVLWANRAQILAR
jgi:hypothetical protein